MDVDRHSAPQSQPSERELRRLLAGWHGTRCDYPRDSCLHQLFEMRVEQTPDATAMIFESARVSYRELNRWANRVAHRLRAMGVGPETLVGICIERSIEMVIGLLGILKAGGAYVPLDPSYPRERLNFMIEDAQVGALLSRAELVTGLQVEGMEVIYLDSVPEAASETGEDNPEINAGADNPAYVIYTSGSTGAPKGVLGLHRGAVNRCHWMWDVYPFEEGEVCCQKTSLNFLDSMWEIFGPLLCGTPNVIIPDQVAKDPVKLTQTLIEHRVTRLVLVPSLLSVLLEYYESHRGPGELKLWSSSGERLLPALAQRFAEVVPWGRLLNLYGSSEVSADVSWSELEVSPAYGGRVTIGRPIANTGLYVLSEQLQPAPAGVSGSLYAAGDGLARGYLNRPEATAEKFVPDPLSATPGARMYKTGDLACYLANGDLEFIGRGDHQVKISGYRVELGEIEAVLAQHDLIKAVVVMVREDEPGDRRLVAYIVPEQSRPPAMRDLHAYLRKKVPEYMIPHSFVVLEHLPQTESGKVNRLALPAPEKSRPEGEELYLAPRTPTEEIVAEIWAGALGLEKVGVKDNYFELGGHSLAAMRIVLRIQSAFEIDLPMACLWEAPTVSLLSAKIDEALSAGELKRGLALMRAPRSDVYDLSYSQKRMWLSAQLDSSIGSLNVTITLRITGQLNVEGLAQTLAEEIRRQHSLTTIYEADEGKVTQRIVPPQPLQLLCVDLRGLPRSDRQRQALRLAMAESKRPFDLNSGLLLRCRRSLLDESEQFVLIDIHNIATDEWSVILLEREIREIYRSFVDGRPSPLPELEVRYVDFAYSQQQWLRDGLLDGQRAYWRRQLAGAPESVNLPADRPVPKKLSFRGAYHGFLIPSSVAQSLKAIGDQESATVFMTLYAAFTVFLYRLTQQTDIVIGTNITNRSYTGLEQVIGFFVNALALRTRVSCGASFRDVLRAARQTAVEAYSNQDLPHEEVIKELSQGKPAAKLFNVFFLTEDDSTYQFELPGVTIAPVRLNNSVAFRDLSLYAKQEDLGLVCAWNYKTDLIDHRTIERWCESFKLLIESIARHPDLPIEELDFLSAEERETQTAAQQQREQRLLDRFKTIQRKIRPSDDKEKCQL